MSGLFGELGVLDDVFDGFFLLPSHFIVAPPHWSLVLALQTQVLACFATRFALIALLPSKSACEASCAWQNCQLWSCPTNPCKTSGTNPPVRERRCIFDGVCLEVEDAFDAAMFIPDLLVEGVFDGDMEKILVQIDGGTIKRAIDRRNKPRPRKGKTGRFATRANY